VLTTCYDCRGQATFAKDRASNSTARQVAFAAGWCEDTLPDGNGGVQTVWFCPLCTWWTAYRDDGRVELVCPHGVGHTSKLLTIKRIGEKAWQDWMDVHGCDNCCLTPAFTLLEQRSSEE
jgi:hypothetical protein